MNMKKGLGIVAIIALAGFVIYALTANNSDSDEGFEVRTAAIESQDVTETVSTQGLIQPANTQEVFGQGLVVDVNVSEGDDVSEGDTLAEYAEMGDVSADFNGTVTELNIQAESPDMNGQLGQPSIKIESLSNLEVKLELSQNDAADVEVDQDVTLTYQDQELQGTIDYIAPTASSEGGVGGQMGGAGDSQVLEAIVAFADDQDLDNLVAGFDIDVSIQTNASENALVIPIEALNFDNDGQPFVFVKDGEVAKQVAIETGLQSELVIEVTDGDLSEGDEVILSPDEDLSDGDPVGLVSEEE